MEYDFYIPHRLKGISPLIWEQKTSVPKKWSFLPEFNIDLIFNLDQPWLVQKGPYKERSFNPTENFCFLSGLHTRPLQVAFSHCHMFGMRLNTLSANLLFGIDCKELKDWSIEGELVLGNKLAHIQDKVNELPDFRSRAVWLEEFMCSLLTHHSDLGMAMRLSALLDEFCDERATGNNFRIEDHTGYSRMHTLCIFQKWFGVSPTEALAFRRFEKALNLIHHSTDNFTQIGLNCGFYDQSHFIRVFKGFAEMTPGHYARIRTEMVGQLDL